MSEDEKREQAFVDWVCIPFAVLGIVGLIFGLIVQATKPEPAEWDGPTWGFLPQTEAQRESQRRDLPLVYPPSDAEIH